MDAKRARELLLRQAQTWLNENYQLNEKTHEAINNISTFVQLKIAPENWKEHSYKVTNCALLLGYKTRHFPDKFINLDF